MAILARAQLMESRLGLNEDWVAIAILDMNNLEQTPNGRSWLEVLPVECIRALNVIDILLAKRWDSCSPSRDKVLLPLHMIAPQQTRLVIICKEPYSKSMATGVPVEVPVGGDFNIWPPSADIFKDFISKYCTDVTKHNFMHMYYQSGILIINAAFSKAESSDKRYIVSNSHFPLWTRFTWPLVNYLNKTSIPILALGVEGKSLVSELQDQKIVHHCSFPRDYKSRDVFHSIMAEMMSTYVFRQPL